MFLMRGYSVLFPEIGKAARLGTRSWHSVLAPGLGTRPHLAEDKPTHIQPLLHLIASAAQEMTRLD
jgi:hypothetical protein